MAKYFAESTRARNTLRRREENRKRNIHAGKYRWNISRFSSIVLPLSTRENPGDVKMDFSDLKILWMGTLFKLVMESGRVRSDADGKKRGTGVADFPRRYRNSRVRVKIRTFGWGWELRRKSGWIIRCLKSGLRLAKGQFDVYQGAFMKGRFFSATSEIGISLCAQFV